LNVNFVILFNFGGALSIVLFFHKKQRFVNWICCPHQACRLRWS